eukprot:4259356-Amphidinium_carterae.1
METRERCPALCSAQRGYCGRRAKGPPKAEWYGHDSAAASDAIITCRLEQQQASHESEFEAWRTPQRQRTKGLRFPGI